jgi:predicted NBD/HSP70 family sugar kinase
MARRGKNRGSPGTLREGNRTRVVDALRREGTASRSELVRATGLSRTTVGTVVADLLERGLAVEQPPAPEAAGRGRPAARVRLDAAAGAAVGIDFGHRHLRVAVADLSSHVLAERWVELDVDHEADDALAAAVDLVDRVLVDAGIERGRVVGAGMGLPGPIDARSGTVGSSVILPGWSGVDARNALAHRLGLPVEVDNDANLGARAEAAYGAGRGCTDLVYVKVASGIGAGLVLGGRLHAGAAGIAGELGHIQVTPDGAVCRCGNRGCLESVAAVPALLELLRPARGDDLGMRGLVRLLEGDDPAARRVVTDAGRVLGRVLADLCNALNPQAIVVGGDLSAAGAPLFDGINESLGRYALPAVAESLRIVAGELGERAEVLGALALVITETDRVRSTALGTIGAA